MQKEALITYTEEVVRIVGQRILGNISKPECEMLLIAAANSFLNAHRKPSLWQRIRSIWTKDPFTLRIAAFGGEWP